jgi:hypothetical protein
LQRCQLRDHLGCYLRPALILNRKHGPNQQFAIELHGSSVPVQVGGFRSHRKGSFLTIFPGESDGSAEGHSGASPLGNTAATGNSG